MAYVTVSLDEVYLNQYLNNENKKIIIKTPDYTRTNTNINILSNNLTEFEKQVRKEIE